MSVFFQPIEPYGIQSGFLDRFVDFPFPQYLRSHDIREIELPTRDRRLRVGRENASPPPILRNRVPFGTLRSHTLEQSGKMGVCFFPLGNARRSFRTRRGARATLPHPPPTLHRSLWLLLSPPTSSLASTPSSSACRARSPTRTPVRRHRRGGRAASCEISDDTTAAGTARPGATRRSRRFRRSRTDIHPPRRVSRSAAARKNVKAARNVQVRPE
jgi:hypothetical protein